MSELPAAPVSLARARLLLGWLRAQRAVDNGLSELLAAGPAGERRVRREIDRVTELVAAATAAFEAYSACVREGVEAPAPDNVTDLRSISLDSSTSISQ